MQENVIFGIDIAKGSVRAKEEPRYAVVILKGSEAEHHRMVSRQKLLRMAWQEKPALIAVDNIFELASGKHELASILSKLPANTKLIQVTGGENLLPLVKLAKQQGIIFDRFDPNAEALACARLARMGIGYEVSAFEEKTIIKVSRARSPGRGGWSQNRYRRKMHGPRSQVHIGSGKYGDVQVNVKSIERDALAFKPLKTRKRDYIIVGIDPGTTTAIAVLTLEGELQMLHSSRTISIPDVIEMIAEQGRPLIIASDVFPTPNAVEKIRRAFNAVSGSPDVILTAGDKIEFATPYGY
ncbi:MAG: DUF460 domain-containing protein [Candidatus Methanoperedens sp.]|nr:DUF460 domain-containing protein [Candidatus Methanoperedens sp.]